MLRLAEHFGSLFLRNSQHVTQESAVQGGIALDNAGLISVQVQGLGPHTVGQSFIVRRNGKGPQLQIFQDRQQFQQILCIEPGDETRRGEQTVEAQTHIQAEEHHIFPFFWRGLP